MVMKKTHKEPDLKKYVGDKNPQLWQKFVNFKQWNSKSQPEPWAGTLFVSRKASFFLPNKLPLLQKPIGLCVFMQWHARLWRTGTESPA